MYLYFGGGIFAEFLGIFLQFFWIFFSWTLLKIFLAQDNSGFNGQMMEFLVQLSHDEGSQSYDLHHMFLHSFTVHLAQVSSQFGLLMEKVMWTDCTVLHSQGWLSSDEEESYHFLSCNISLTLTPQLCRNVSRMFYLRLWIVGKLDSWNVYKKGWNSFSPKSILHLYCHHRKSQSQSLVSALSVVSQLINHHILCHSSIRSRLV